MDMEAHYVIFSSFGNDSIALMQLARKNGLKNVDVAYSNTQWAAKWWPDRVAECADITRQLGWRFTEIPSEGFKNMVKRKKGFPRQGYQYCTGELKIIPALAWLENIDPERKAIVIVGLRQEESAARKDTPDFRANSPTHGGRMCLYPLARHTVAMRDDLIRDFGFEPLPHRSMECFPCINSKRSDLVLLSKDKERIEEIAAFEKEMGVGERSGKKKTMFRPYRHQGATGIKEVIKWALSPRGKYDKNQDELFMVDDGTDGENEGGCQNGWCGI